MAASFCWCGTGEGVTHHCGADLGNITVLVKPTMTPSIVWMGSVGHMVSPRPLPLWRHAKWFCTKLGITVYFYAAFVYGWVSVQGWLQCLSGSHSFFFLCLHSGDICGRGHYVCFFCFCFFFGLTVRPSVRLIHMNAVSLEFLEGISSDLSQMSTWTQGLTD